MSRLVQLLIPNLHGVSLTALVLQEGKNTDGEDGNDGDVAWVECVSFVSSPNTRWAKYGWLTEHESGYSSSEIDNAFEKVDDEVDGAAKQPEGEVEGLQNEVAGGGEERVDDFDERGDQVGEGFYDGGHFWKVFGKIRICEGSRLSWSV
jgi:hypothetical protein